MRLLHPRTMVPVESRAEIARQVVKTLTKAELIKLREQIDKLIK